VAECGGLLKPTCPIRTDRFSRVLFALGTAQLQAYTLICSLKFSKSSADFSSHTLRNCELQRLSRRLCGRRCLIGALPAVTCAIANPFVYDRRNRCSESSNPAVPPDRRRQTKSASLCLCARAGMRVSDGGAHACKACESPPTILRILLTTNVSNKSGNLLSLKS
jgi:hypothetical protein